ncbi:MAG: hypothetical protein WCO26_15850 [Deltaproteobacteria bacterium]
MSAIKSKFMFTASLLILLFGCASCLTSETPVIPKTAVPTTVVENAGSFSVDQNGQIRFFRRTNSSQSLVEDQLFAMKPGEKPVPLLADQSFLPGNIIWAPDGQAVYFFDTHANKQWVINFPEGDQIREISQAVFRTWAPTGDRFLAVSTDLSDQASLVTYDANCNRIGALDQEMETLQKLFQSLEQNPDMTYLLNYNDIDMRWVKDRLILILQVESRSKSWIGRAIVQLDLLNRKASLVSQGHWDLILPSPSGEYLFFGAGAPASEQSFNGSWLVSKDGQEWQISEYKAKLRAAWSEDGKYLYYFEPLWEGSLKSAPDDGDVAFSQLRWQLIRFDPRTQQKITLYTDLPLAGESLVRGDTIYFIDDDNRLLTLPLFP